MNIYIKGKFILGIILLGSGLIIWNNPDILQYILAMVLSLSGIGAIISSFRDRSSGGGAHFVRKDPED